MLKLSIKINPFLNEEVTSFLDDDSVMLTERFVANFVGINQLSFLPYKVVKKRKMRHIIMNKYTKLHHHVSHHIFYKYKHTNNITC
jgi:hypothetical protein